MATSNYNAGTAWNYLGTGLFDGRGAYDYSTAPKNFLNFRNIVSGVEARRPFNSWRDYDESTQFTKNINSPITMNNIETILPAISNLPQTIFKNALAGKYTEVI